MSRLRGRSQDRESQESRRNTGAVFQDKHFGAAKARPRLIALLLALVTLLAYLPATRDGFWTMMMTITSRTIPWFKED